MFIGSGAARVRVDGRDKAHMSINLQEEGCKGREEGCKGRRRKG